MTDYLVSAWQLSDFDGPFSDWNSVNSSKPSIVGSNTHLSAFAQKLDFIVTETSTVSKMPKLSLVEDTYLSGQLVPKGTKIEPEGLFETSHKGHGALIVARLGVPASNTELRLVFTVGAANRGGDFQIVAANENRVRASKSICFAKGTMIDTPHGEMPIEMLEEGDEVVTANGGIEQIAWVGKRSLTAFELSMYPDLQPIRIKQNALAPNMPTQDLIVSPNHKVLIDDWRAEYHFGVDKILVPAKSLLNGTDIVTDNLQTGVDYFHVLLESHDLLRANGQWAESLLPVPEALATLTDNQVDEINFLIPDFFHSLSSNYMAYLPIASQQQATILAA